MPKQRKVKRINAFGGSIAKTKPELDDKIDVYPNPESSESINVSVSTRFFLQTRMVIHTSRMVNQTRTVYFFYLKIHMMT